MLKIKLSRLDWLNLSITALLFTGVFLPWTHGFAYPAKFIPPGYNPWHNGLDELNAGAGYALLCGSLAGLVLWLIERNGPRQTWLIVPLIKLTIGGGMLYMVKIHYDDFDYFTGFTVLPGFWVALAGLFLWLGLAVVELVGNFRRIARARTFVN